MTNREFLIWLLGYLQLCSADQLNRKKLWIIKNHMNLVKAVDGQFSDTNGKIWDSIVAHLENNVSEEKIAGFGASLEQWVLAA